MFRSKLTGFLSLFGLQIMLAPSDDSGQNKTAGQPPTAPQKDHSQRPEPECTTTPAARSGGITFKSERFAHHGDATSTKSLGVAHGAPGIDQLPAAF